MERNKTLIIVAALVASLYSCGSKEGGSNSGGADSQTVVEQLESKEVDGMTSLINEVALCLDSIQMQEKLVMKTTSETTDREKILTQIRSYKDLLARKQARIDELMRKNTDLNNSSKKTIQNLQNMIAFLQTQIEQKDRQVANLEKQVNLGKAKLDNVLFDYAIEQDENDYLTEQNSAQEKRLNTAYYISAPKKTLKELGLLKTGIFSKKLDNEGIDESKFKKVDIRNCDKIKIASKSPKILTNNPTSSYNITKNDDGTSVLEITDSKRFWNVSRYLIIQE